MSDYLYRTNLIIEFPLRISGHVAGKPWVMCNGIIVTSTASDRMIDDIKGNVAIIVIERRSSAFRDIGRGIASCW